MRTPAAILAALRATLAAMPAELRAVHLAGPRAGQATVMATAVVLSTVAACALRLPDPWWAALTGFLSTQATRPASLTKAALRAAGTVAGAALALLSIGWLAYDPVACCLALFAVGSMAILGMLVSPHGYAWFIGGITFALVVLMSLETPTQAFAIAVDRTAEVGVGTTVAVLIALAVAPEGAAGAPAAPGWTDLLGARWPAGLHALRSGVAIAVLPLVWRWTDLPGLTTMATTMVSVLGVPAIADHPMDGAAQIITRAVHRALGCLVGGALAVALLAVPLDATLAWLAALFAGVWVFAHVQGSRQGLGYLGVQAAFVFIIMLVQGAGPPTSLLPALNRLAGILAGLLTLLAVSTVIRPDATPPDATPTKGLTARQEPI